MKIQLNFWIRILVPLFLTLYLGFIMYMLMQFREPPGFAWHALLWFATTIYIIWEVGWYISEKLNQQVPWQKGVFKRLWMQLLITNLIGIAIFLGTYIILNTYENIVRGNDNPLSIFHLMVNTALAFIIVQIINSIQIGYLLLNNWQQVRMESEQMRKEKAIHELENIRQQFNKQSLMRHLYDLENVIAESPEEAAIYLQNISKTYDLNFNQLDNQLEDVQQKLKVSALATRTPSKKTKKSDAPVYKNRFLVKSGAKMTVVHSHEIAGFYKDDLVLLITDKGKKYAVDHSLDELLTLLSPTAFFRINRQCIIHIAAIHEARTEGTQLVLTTSVDFPKALYVSQRNVGKFKKWLNEEV